MKMKKLVIALLLLFLSAADALAQTPNDMEAAAAPLQAQGKFFCHRNFRATGWTAGAFDPPNSWRESDQVANDTNICGIAAGGFKIFWTNTGAAPSVATGINGLPVVSMTADRGAIIFITIPVGSGPGQQGQLTNNGRIGIRFYRWTSDAEACDSAKFVQVGAYWTGQRAPGGVVWQGSGGVPGTNTANFRNKWWRWEVYVDPVYSDAAQTSTLILKNITDSGPELSGTVDASIIDAGSIANHTDPIHEYRDQQGIFGICTNRYTHLLIAKNLAPGERIPSAVEVEGGGGPIAPTRPCCLILSFFYDLLFSRPAWAFGWR